MPTARTAGLLAAALGLWLVLLPVGVAHASAPWAVAIVATDAKTHDVGAAGSDCSPEDASAMTAIVPGAGAGATLPTDVGVSELMAAALRRHPAARALRQVRAHTRASQTRAFAAATPGSVGATAVGTRVAAGGEWVGRGAAIVTVGVPPAALSAAGAALSAPGRLPDRLLAALEAAAAGHACGQKPSAAFLIVVPPGGDTLVPARGLAAARERQREVLAKFNGQLASDEMEDRLLAAGALPKPTGKGAPTVDLSLLQPPGGFEAVPLLHDAYAAVSLTPTPAPTPAPAPSPSRSTPPRRSAGYLVVAAVLAAGAVAALLIARRLRGMERGAADGGETETPDPGRPGTGGGR